MTVILVAKLEVRRGSDPAIERDYRTSISDGDRRTNFYTLAIALPLYALYAVIDTLWITHPNEAVLIRLGAAAVAAVPFLAMGHKALRNFHGLLAAASVVALGAGINLIIWRDPNFEHNYYVALIQGGIFVSFLARLSFWESILVLATFLVGFVFASAGKDPQEEALLQIFVLITMFAMCAFGIKLTQALRRQDYFKSMTIARQNDQLNSLLADAQQDNERKLAALNVLVHFVRTPIHQIVGFTGVIANSLKELSGPGLEDQIAHAEFVRRASVDLSTNVAKVLTYYRLDEHMKGAIPESVPVNDLLSDLRDDIAEAKACELVGKSEGVSTYLEPLRAAFAAIAMYYKQERQDVREVRLTPLKSEQSLRVEFTDDGAPLTAQAFDDQVRPLVKIDSYLTTDGSAMPMNLRTVARAAEICGGALTWGLLDGRNVFLLEIADKTVEKSAAA